MLTQIRDRSTGWMAWVIAALIIIPMAFWGIGNNSTTEVNPALVEIGNQKITQSQFDAQLYNEQQRQRQALGGQINNSFLNSPSFRQNVLDRMINRAVVDNVANEHNYQIGNQQLSGLIKQSELFKVDGKFDPAAYERYIAGSTYSKTQFENQVREDSRVGQVLSGYQESALVLPDETRFLLERQAEQRSFDLLAIRQQTYIESATATDEEIADYYSTNQQDYMEPKKVSLSYVELTLEQILTEVDVDEENLLDTYEQNIESYISEETRDTRHILLSVDGDNDDEQRAKAESLVTELRAGADFAELAKENSDDPGSAANGGDLGTVTRGAMVAEFEETTFELPESDISDPIKTQFGYHIIQVQKINASEQQSFEDVRFDIEQEEKQRLAEEEMIVRVEQLRDLAYEQPEDLTLVVEEMSLEIQTTELFAQNSGTGLAQNAVVRDTAFDDELLIEKNNSEPIETASGSYVVIRNLDVQETRPLELATVSEQIKQLLLEEKASEAAAEDGRKMLSQAQSDWPGLLTSVEESKEIELSSHTITLADQERTVDAEVLIKVTNMQLENNVPTVKDIATLNGDYYIVRLTKIAEGDVNTISEQIKDSTRRVLEQRNGESLASAYLESLRTDLASEIDVNSL